jgi:hypothetical protein
LWCEVQHELALARLRLGEVQQGVDTLYEALDAVQEAQREWRQETSPLNWALAQLTQGLILHRLAEREDTQPEMRVLQAIKAHRNALTVYSEGKMPQRWAAAQNGIGVALLSSYRITDDASLLEEAISIFEAVMNVGERLGAPVIVDYAQRNLEVARTLLGLRASTAAVQVLETKQQ